MPAEDLEEVEESPLGISVAEAAARLSLSEKVVISLIEAGRLKGEKLGKRWYVDPMLQIKPSASAPPRGPQASSPPGLSAPRGGDPFFALRSLPDDHVIEIYRLKQGKYYYVCSMAPEEFSLRAVQRDFGGGVYVAKGTSDGQVVAQHGFAIAGPEKHPDDPPAYDPQPSLPPTNDLQSLQLQQLAGQVQALQQALMAMASNARPQESEDSRKRWLEEMLLMKQALAPPPAPPQMSPEESRKRWLEEIMLLRQVFAQPQQQTGIEAISGALMKGVEMAATVSSIGEKEGVGTALIKGMIPTLSEVVGGIAKNILSPPQAAPEIQPESLRQIPVTTTPNPSGEPDGNGRGHTTGIEMLLPLLKRAARENRDPYPYASMILSEMPPEAVGHLRAATTEQFAQFAASLDPQLAEYPGWVGELRAAMIGELEDENGGNQD